MIKKPFTYRVSDKQIFLIFITTIVVCFVSSVAFSLYLSSLYNDFWASSTVCYKMKSFECLANEVQTMGGKRTLIMHTIGGLTALNGLVFSSVFLMIYRIRKINLSELKLYNREKKVKDATAF